MVVTESFLNGRITLHCGDCLDVLATLPENSIDSVVTDPPYHLTSIVKRFKDTKESDNTMTSKRVRERSDGYARLVAGGFMGKQWDGGDIAQSVDLWSQVYRVLKPGAHLLAFGSTRTQHRMVCAIEDAGFEIRDTILYLFGSGFPKSHDVSKGIDRAAGKKGLRGAAKLLPNGREHHFNIGFGEGEGFDSQKAERFGYEPATDAARQWQGWGTALKPACEPIVLARKPLSEKTVAANVLKWGTGAINVNGCRVGIDGGTQKTNPAKRASENCYGDGLNGGGVSPINAGRWPANVVLDGSEEMVRAFPESNGHFGDNGSAARFFYTAKADSDDRSGSKHPTVKPLDLMQYLVRLVMPKGGTVLDLFAGTGTTGEAAWREGMNAVLIEREAEYQADIRRRMELCLSGPDERQRKSIQARMKDKPADHGPLFGGVA